MIPEQTKDITVAWLNEALHANGFLTDARIVSLAREPIAVGQGFMSDMAKLTVAYDRDAPNLPTTMIAKLPATYESARAVAMQLNLYEREIRFYQDAAPKSPIRTPGLICGEIDSANQRYALLLEDCSHCEQLDQTVGMNYEQAKLATLKLADFHARWWDADDLGSFDWLPGPKDPAVMVLIDVFTASWEACAQHDDFRKMLPAGGWEAGLKLYEHYRWLIENLPENKLTMSHVDYRADNMFFDRGTPDDPLIVFDWGGTLIARGVTNLAYLLGGSLTIDLRRRVEKDLVKLYYQRLLDRGVSGYSYDECRTDYLQGLLVFTIIAVLAFSTLDMSDPRGAELLRVAVDRWFTSIVDNDATSVLP